MARDVPARGDTAVEGAVKAGKAAQEAVPKGATEYKTREDRNDSCVPRHLGSTLAHRQLSGSEARAVKRVGVT